MSVSTPTPPYVSGPNDLSQPLRDATFGQAFQRYWKKYASFEGRASRSEYWYAVLGVAPCAIVVDLLADLVSGVFFVVLLAFVIPGIAVSVRRLHDIGKSGWFYLIGLIPVVGSIILIVWYATAETPAGDRYNI